MLRRLIDRFRTDHAVLIAIFIMLAAHPERIVDFIFDVLGMP